MHMYWHPLSLSFFVIMYIIVYLFTLWFSPLYFLTLENKKPLIALSYGLLIIYLIALPFYLFFPVTNVYVFNNLPSALNTIIPEIETFFYHTTTVNNCFPSLHVAMSITVAWSSSYLIDKKFHYFTIFSMISVIISVMYLSIHWILDVIGGIIIASTTIIIIRRFIMEQK